MFSDKYQLQAIAMQHCMLNVTDTSWAMFYSFRCLRACVRQQYLVMLVLVSHCPCPCTAVTSTAPSRLAISSG